MGEWGKLPLPALPVTLPRPPVPVPVPSLRALRWYTLGTGIRVAAVEELAAIEGLDGAAATAAAAHALTLEDSPWGAAVDAAMAAAVRRCVLEPVSAIGRALAEALQPVVDAAARAFDKAGATLEAAGYDLTPPEPPGTPCRCFCGSHRPIAEGVCEGETTSPEIVVFPAQGQAHAIEMCPPCARVQRPRAVARWQQQTQPVPAGSCQAATGAAAVVHNLSEYV